MNETTNVLLGFIVFCSDYVPSASALMAIAGGTGWIAGLIVAGLVVINYGRSEMAMAMPTWFAVAFVCVGAIVSMILGSIEILVQDAKHEG